MSITVLLEFPVRQDVDNVDEVLRTDLPATAAYPGNELTEVIADESQPGKLFLLTRWSDAQAYDRYAAWRGSPEGATHLSDIAAGPPTIHRYRSHLRF